MARMDHSISTQQQQEIHLSNSLESMVASRKTQQERKSRPQQEQAVNCPRCDSINTKFCYYNNYSLTQPRYFCKSCKRYWTKGGTLRNIPVGGGCRKTKNSSSSSSSSSFMRSSNDQTFPLDPTMAAHRYSSDLRLAFKPISGFENHGYADTFRDRFPESYLNSCRNLQSGFENGEMGRVENGCLKPSFDHDDIRNLTTSKDEGFVGQEIERNLFWGIPWQINGDGNTGDIDLRRDYQNRNVISSSSSWPHGFLYSHLM